MDLHRLMAPRSIVVVGASPRLGSYGNQALLNLRIAGFDGVTHGVHPSATEVHGFPCVPSLSDLADAPDAILIATPAATVPALVDEAGSIGVGGAVVIAAGFGEVAHGRGLQDDLRAAALKHDLPVCGPNGNGLVSLHSNAPLWGDAYRLLEPGPVALISQSGNVAVNTLAIRQGLRLHTVVSCGNQAVLDASDYLAHLAKADGVRSIALYLEHEGDGAALASALADCAEREVGVVVLKAGRSAAGAEAAAAHTGAVAGDARVLESLVAEAGAAWVNEPHELLEVAKAFAYGRRSRGRVAVVTCSGGDSATSADEAHRLGVPLARFGPATTAALGKLLPATATVANPLDYTAVIWGDHERIAQLIDTVADAPDVGQVLVYYDRPEPLDDGTVASWDDTLTGIIEGAASAASPVSVASTLASLLPDDTADRLARAGIPPLAGLTVGLTAVRALGQPPGDPVRLREIARAHPTTAVDGGEWLAEDEAKQLLRAAGIAVPDGALVHSADSAIEAAAGLHGPVALKVSSADLQHKSDVGALALDVVGAADVAAAYAAVTEAHPGAPVLVEAMVGPGVEILVSVRRDGPLGALVVAIGGVWVEVLDDAVVIPLPVDSPRVERALRQLRGASLLTGGRGRAAVDLTALAQVAAAVAHLAVVEDLALVELNPVIARPDGAVVVDALIRRSATTSP